MKKRRRFIPPDKARAAVLGGFYQHTHLAYVQIVHAISHTMAFWRTILCWWKYEDRLLDL